MNDKLHIADSDLALYAMGALPQEELKAIEGHLKSCSRCQEEVRQNTLALAAYGQTTAEVAPPAGARDRFLARLAETPQTTSSKAERRVIAQPLAKPSLWKSIFAGSWSPLLAGALALTLLVVGWDDLNERAEIGPLLHQARKGSIDSAQFAQLVELLTSPQEKRVALHPGPVTAPPPEGRVVYAARTGKLLMTASNLHPLPAGKTYELWILQPGGKAPMPAGTFEPDSSGNATLILASEPAGLAVAGFGVTIENAGGSQTPTLPIVLSGL